MGMVGVQRQQQQRQPRVDGRAWGRRTGALDTSVSSRGAGIGGSGSFRRDVARGHGSNRFCFRRAARGGASASSRLPPRYAAAGDDDDDNYVSLSSRSII